MNAGCCVVHEEGKSICICPWEKSLSLLGKKWAVLILRIVDAEGTAGYNTIYSQISGITPKAFGDKLKDLENVGLVKRHVLSQNPLRVHYSLTPEGKRLLLGLAPILSKARQA